MNRRVLLGLIAAFAILRFQALEKDFSFFADRRVKNWHVHHDEKLVVPDARSLFLSTRNPDARMADYHPSFSAVFGIGGPAIVWAGYEIFGLNNLGLRFFFILIGLATDYLLIRSVFAISPPWLAACFTAVWLANYYHWVLQGLAVLENVAAFYLVLILWLYLTRKDLVLRHLAWISFLAGSSLLIKVNFPFYVYLLLGCIALREAPTLRTLRTLCWAGCLGLLLFEGLQALVLWKWGVLRDRLHILEIVTIQTSETSWKPWTHPMEPEGTGTFKSFLIMVAERLLVPLGSIRRDPFGLSILAAPLVLGVGALLAVLLGTHLRSRWHGIVELFTKPAQAITLFLLAFLGCSCFFYFYLKRAAPVFPVVFLWFSLLGASAARALFPNGNPAFSRKALIAIFLITASWILPQALLWSRAWPGRSADVFENSRRLDTLLPPQSTIYAHCYGLRFFWQAGLHRFISIEDTWMNSPLIASRALRENGRYLLIGDRPETTPFPWPDEKAESFGVPKVSELKGRLRRIADFRTGFAASDVADRYVLYEIRD